MGLNGETRELTIGSKVVRARATRFPILLSRGVRETGNEEGGA